MFMTKPNPGRMPPLEQRVAAEQALYDAAKAYYEAIAEPTRKFYEAIAAAAGPPVGVPKSENKSLVTRRRMVEIIRDADPDGEGLSIHAISRIVDLMHAEKS